MLRLLPLLLLLAACVDADAPHDPHDDAIIEFTVPRGATARSLGARLVEQDLVRSEFNWTMFLRSADADCVKAGRFALRRNMSMREVLQTLCGVPLAEDVPFTVVEGWRIREIDEALAQRGWIEPGEYARLAESKEVTLPFEITSPTLEGYLYPETYRVEPDRFTAQRFIERQLRTFQERFLATHGENPELQRRGLHAVVVMASMLEREEPVVGQRPIVAGILWKRLDHRWQLGVDATSRYLLDEWNDRRAFLRRLRDPECPYNTRIHHGLPPTAIGNPSQPSLEASIQPQDSPYWFYLHDAQGRFHGAVDGAGHEANRRRYNVW